MSPLDILPHKLEIFPKYLNPFFFRTRMMLGDPLGEPAVGFANFSYLFRVMDDGFDFEPVANNPLVVQKPIDVFRTILGDTIDIEAMKSLHDGRAFFENQ